MLGCLGQYPLIKVLPEGIFKWLQEGMRPLSYPLYSVAFYRALKCIPTTGQLTIDWLPYLTWLHIMLLFMRTISLIHEQVCTPRRRNLRGLSLNWDATEGKVFVETICNHTSMGKCGDSGEAAVSTRSWRTFWPFYHCSFKQILLFLSFLILFFYVYDFSFKGLQLYIGDYHFIHDQILLLKAGLTLIKDNTPGDDKNKNKMGYLMYVSLAGEKIGTKGSLGTPGVRLAYS